MTKWELIGVTLSQLISQWGVEPNHRDQFDVTYINVGPHCNTVIKWSPKTTYGAEEQQTHLSKVIQITYKQTGWLSGSFECTISNVQDSGNFFHKNQKENNIESEHHSLAALTKLTRRFRTLEENIIRYKKMKENNHFLEDLIKIFPRTLDGAILGDDYDD